MDEFTKLKKQKIGRALVFGSFSALLVIIISLPLLVPKPEKVVVQPSQVNEQVLGAESRLSPVRLKIPSIGVDASVENLKVTSEGAMESPQNTMNVGWFELGPLPGEKGSAVIAGHFDGVNGEPGVFVHLSQLKMGDTIYTENANGKATVFVVRESTTYDPGYAEEVFGDNNGTHLNLITCDGTWDKDKKSYSKRLVVFADLVN